MSMFPPPVCVRLGCKYITHLDFGRHSTTFHCVLIHEKDGDRWNVDHLMNVIRKNRIHHPSDVDSVLKCVNYKKLKLIAKLEQI